MLAIKKYQSDSRQLEMQLRKYGGEFEISRAHGIHAMPTHQNAKPGAGADPYDQKLHHSLSRLGLHMYGVSQLNKAQSDASTTWQRQS